MAWDGSPARTTAPIATTLAIADSICRSLGNGQTADRLTQVYRRDGGEGRWQRSSSIAYDFLGRKTGMSDADLSNWSYAYNALGQLTRQTDARAKTSCLYYDDLGRMRGRVQRTDVNCATTVADADLDSSYVYDAQGRVQSESNDNVSRSFIYDSYSRLRSETVTIDSLTRTSSYSYDDHYRPTAVTYSGSEVITTTYGSPGTTVGLSSSVHGALVDSVKYDEAGRMTALRFPAGGNLWRTQSYYPWTEAGNGGKLEMKYRVSSEVRSGSGRLVSTMTRLWRSFHSWSGSRNSGAEIPTVPGFDATVVLCDRLVVVVGDIGKFVLPLQREHCVDSIMQLSLILFACQDIVGAALGDLLRNRFLTADCVD